MPSAFQQLSSVRVAHNFTRAPSISEMTRRGPVLKWLGTEPVILLQYRFTKDGNNVSEYHLKSQDRVKGAGIKTASALPLHSQWCTC